MFTTQEPLLSTNPAGLDPRTARSRVPEMGLKLGTLKRESGEMWLVGRVRVPAATATVWQSFRYIHTVPVTFQTRPGTLTVMHCHDGVLSPGCISVGG